MRESKAEAAIITFYGMLENYIIEKARQLSYTRAEVADMDELATRFKSFADGCQDFANSFVSGSLKRQTMVKGISDVDIYFEFVGTGTPTTALTALKNRLLDKYPDLAITQLKPSVKVQYQGVSFNLVPYLNANSGTIKIPNDDLSGWKMINLRLLESNVKTLGSRSQDYLQLIKILKYWNYVHDIGLRNYRIEELVCHLFLSERKAGYSIFNWLYVFFHNYRYYSDANMIHQMARMADEDPQLRSSWFDYIENNYAQNKVA